MIIAITKRLDIPAIATIPKRAKIHKIKIIEAISRKGEGNIPISHTIIKNINKSQRVITWFIKLKRGKGEIATTP